MRPASKFPTPKVIAVDVDGTLLKGGTADGKIIEWCRKKKSEGYSMTLWSSRGEAHARRAAELCEASDIFDHIISKPGYILDDKGWSWIRFTGVIKDLSTEVPNHIDRESNP